ncbi:uncharacterized protein [Littorina saxatilis]|uniref:BZIP domain-containing protein n=1 Tax=Littorina saxatilis TaxID=31220 RepID=A0AAN9GLK5_9CAEN
MGEVGKEMLRERIRNKRASEGLNDIPQEELFAKKPRYELSSEEKEKLSERRIRNKEAAEKSRKKKKEEFEKLQMENEQLAQDKCELAAMIEQLKGDLHKFSTENRTLRQQTDSLKRWIGKRADSLGLVKHGKDGREKRTDKSVLRGDPSMHAAAVSNGHMTRRELPSPDSHMSRQELPAPAPDIHMTLTRPDSPASSTHSASPPPHSASEFQPVGIKTSTKRHTLQTPWLVETPDDTSGQHQDKDDVIFTGMTPPQSPDRHEVVTAQVQGQGQALQVGEDQQVLYLPKDAYFIVQGEDGSQILTPVMQHVAMATPQLVVGAPLVQSVPLGVTQVATPAVSSVAPSIMSPAVTSVAPPVAIASTPQLEAEDLSVRTGSVVTEPLGDVRYAKTAADNTDQVKVKVAGGAEKTTVKDPSVVTAIESLLKLGFKIESPRVEAAMEMETMETETPAVSCQMPSVITVPVDAPESAATLTITTTSNRKKAAITTTTAFSPVMSVPRH